MLARFEKTLDEVRKSHYEYAGGRTVEEGSRIRFGNYTTFGGYAIDGEDGSTAIFRQVDSRFWFNGQRHGHTVYGRIRVKYEDFNSGDSFDGRGDDFVHPFGDRYWYRFDFQQDQRAEEGVNPDWNFWFQAGRQYVDWVTGFVLSDTLYAARAGVEISGFRIEALFAVTPDSIVDFDASRPNYTSDTERYFYGLSVEYLHLAAHRPFVYFLTQQDENDTILPGGVRYGYDSTYVSLGSTGQIVSSQWLYRAEVVYSTGNSTSDVLGTIPQTIDDVSAWAGRILIAFVPYRTRETRGLRFEFEILLGSGDDDRATATQGSGGNLSGTDDESFIGFGYINSGLALAPELANLLSVRIGVAALPFRQNPTFEKLSIQLDFFYYSKLDDNAPLSVTTTAGESYVGIGIDIGASWQITSDTSLDIRYGIFIPGDAVTGSERHFGYMGFSYGF